MFGVSPSTGYAGGSPRCCGLRSRRPGSTRSGSTPSPSGGDPVIRVDTGIAQYFGVGAYLRDLPDARHSRVRFAAECLAFSNLPDPVVEGGVPAGQRRRLGLRRRARALPAAAVRRATRPRPTPQRVTGEVMADVFGEWRRPDSGCGGGIVLWLRDVVPGAGWGLLDHEGRPKPAALALAPTLQPTAVWFVDEGLNGLDVHVAHDRPTPLDGDADRRAAARGRVSESAEASWPWRRTATDVAGVEALLGRFADVSYAYRFGPPQHAGVAGPVGDRNAGSPVRSSGGCH